MGTFTQGLLSISPSLTGMWRNHYFYIAFVLILTSACQPGLMVPSTPNIPQVDSTRSKELKVGVGFNKAELQYNRINENDKLFQFQVTQLWTWGFGRSVLQMGRGQLNYGPNGVKTYSLLGLGFSHNHLSDFPYSENLGESIFGAGEVSTYLDIESYQIPIYYQYTHSTNWKKLHIAYTLKPQFTYCFSTKMSLVSTDGFSLQKFVRADINVPHSFYSLVDLNLSVQKNRLGLVLGSKLPLFVSHSAFRAVNIVQEDLYLRWTFRLSK